MSDSPRRASTLRFHKPLCKCNACKRKTEAILRGDGTGRVPVGTALAETTPDPHTLPVIVAEPWQADARTRVLQIVELRARGMDDHEIADTLGLSYKTIRGYLTKAANEGWLRFENPFDRFEHEIVPKVVDNIAHFIKKRDKQMTIEAAKGAGIFKSYGSVKSESDTPQTVLALKIETVQPPGDTPVITGHVIGKARQVKDTDGQ